MGARRCPYTKGTFRAARWAGGRMWIVCHHCRRYIELMITTDIAERQVTRTKFICTRCDGDGSIANEDPVGRGYRARPAGRSAAQAPPCRANGTAGFWR